MNNQNYQNFYGNQMTPEQWALYQQQQQPYYQQWSQNFNQYPSPAFQQYPFSQAPPSEQQMNFAVPPPPPPDDTNKPAMSKPQQPNDYSEQQHSQQFQNSNKNTNTNNRGQDRNRSNWMRNNQTGNRGGRMNQAGNNPKNQQKNWNNNFNNHNSNNSNNRKNQQNMGRNSQASSSQHAPPMNTHFQQSSDQTQAQMQNNITSEVAAFDEQFKRWEKDFNEWKKDNVNHPDKEAYSRYESQFEAVRVQLLAKREEILRKKMKTTANPPKTAEQMKFESQWASGMPTNEPPASAREVEPTIFDPIASSSTQLHPTFDQSETAAAAPILFGSVANKVPLKNQDFKSDEFDDQLESFDDSFKASEFRSKIFDSNSQAIPGLDAPIVDQKENDAQEPEIIDLENDEASGSSSKVDSSFIPIFKSQENQRVVKIASLLEEPGRHTRPDKILILIRGAPGSGKSFIADEICKIEVKNGNDRVFILEFDKFLKNRYDAASIDNANSMQFREARDIIKEGYTNFLIVIVETSSMQQFNNLSQIASKLGNYQCFSIEMHQNLAVCLKNNVHKRSREDIIEAINSLNKLSTPFYVPIIDVTGLFKPQKNTSASKPMPEVQKPEENSDSNNLTDMAKNIAQLLKNEEVLKILQTQMNAGNQEPANLLNIQTKQPPQQAGNLNVSNFPNLNLQPPSIMPPMQNSNFIPNNQMYNQPPQMQRDNLIQQVMLPPETLVEELPTLNPTKIIDYKHEHMPTFEEQLMEFRVLRVIDYRHKTTHQLWEFVKEIDVDKISEKRKAVALRKKILEYLRSAERPEDTVSNPKYPMNWEVIEKERPPRRNKRRKRITSKIKRIKMQIAGEQANWMMCEDESGGKPMDLEEISSDDMSDGDEKPSAVEKTVDNYCDEYEGIFKTIPDFNHFKHSKVLDIKKILWHPDRRSRAKKILIILRGAPGSGKSHLCQLIKRKESEMGNASEIRILSIDDYFATHDDEDMDYADRKKYTQTYSNEMLKYLRKTMNEGSHSIIIIDADNCDLGFYKQFHQYGVVGGYAVYTIELYQTLDICTKQCTSVAVNIRDAIDLLEKNRIAEDHTLLIPTALYAEYNCFVNKAVLDSPTKKNAESAVSSKESISNYKKYLVQTIAEKTLESMPQFNWHNREIMNITEILDEPGRSKRAPYIMIILRGPSIEDKKNLASAIIEREREMGNDKAAFLGIDEYFINPSTLKFEFNSNMIDANIQKLTKKLREIMRSKQFNFVIVDCETGDFSHYQQIHQLTSTFFKCYTIELYYDANICAENDMGKLSIQDIDNILEEMQLNATPDDHILLDASIFYKENSEIQPSRSSNRPLKPALKLNECDAKNVSQSQFDLQKVEKYDKIRFDNEQQQFEALFNRRIMINGNFVRRNEKPPSKLPEFNWFNRDVTEIRDILDEPMRFRRPAKIVIFIRGTHGSGKTYLARLIERKEYERNNVGNFKMLSVDSFFEKEQFRKTDKPNRYEKYIELNLVPSLLDDYMKQLSMKLEDLTKAKEFTFIVVDADFADLDFYVKMWKSAAENGYTCYTIELNQDDDICLKYNDHNWDQALVKMKNKKLQEIQIPDHHTLLDAESIYADYSYEFNEHGDTFTIDENAMDCSDGESSNEEEMSHFGPLKMPVAASKWDDYEAPDIDRLDGTKNKNFERLTMADYLQTDEWSMRPSKSGKKRVRWADIEEKKEQERMRQIGFIVGHTDWKRMTDESDGKSALEKTKFIESRHKM